MNSALVVWGIILLVGLGGSPWIVQAAGITEATLWMAWAIIFVVGSWALGKQMKASKEVAGTWTLVNVFGLITTFAVALGYVAAPLSFLMALWFILWGAAMWKAGPKGSAAAASGVILALVGTQVPAWFAGSGYWMAGALFLGLWPVIHSLLMKE